MTTGWEYMCGGKGARQWVGQWCWRGVGVLLRYSGLASTLIWNGFWAETWTMRKNLWCFSGKNSEAKGLEVKTKVRNCNELRNWRKRSWDLLLCAQGGGVERWWLRCYQKWLRSALAGVAQWIECGLQTKGWLVWFPVRAHSWIVWCFSPSLSPSLLL